MSLEPVHTMPQQAALDPQVRSEFPVLDQLVNGAPLVYLDNAATSQNPVEVTEAMEAYYNGYNANIHRGVHSLSQKATEAYESARMRIAAFVGVADSAELIYTTGTTASINTVAHAWGGAHLKAGDVVLVTRMDHHSNIVPWQMIAKEKGAQVLPIEIFENGSLNLASLQKQLDTLPVKVLAFPHVSNALGTIHPAAELVAMAHAAGAIAVVDGAQAAPHVKLDLDALGADFYAFSGHKMYGPTGIGILHGKRALLEAMPPYQGGGEMIAEVSFEGTTYNELPHKFEAGTPPIAAGIGLGAAVDFMQRVGVDTIARWENHLLRIATEGLLAIDGVRIYGTATPKAGVVSFLLDGSHPYDLGTLLDQQGIAVRTGHHCTQPLMDCLGIPGTVRASFAAYNSEEDIERFLAGVRKAASMLR